MKVIAVVGTPELAVELASVTAANTKNNVLIIDLNGMHPSLDYLLRVKIAPPNIKSYREIESDGSLPIIVDAIEKNLLTRDMIAQCAQKKRKRLFVLTGCYSEDNYARMRVEPIEELIRRAGEIFDVTVLVTNSFLYDNITTTAIDKADLVLLPTRANILDIRGINNKFELLIESKNLSGSDSKIDSNKFRHVLFDYNNKCDLPVKVAKVLCKFGIIGIIPSSTLRRSLVNSRTPYIKRMEKNIERQYSKLLNNIGIKAGIHKKALIERILRHISKMLQKRGKVNGNSTINS